VISEKTSSFLGSLWANHGCEPINHNYSQFPTISTKPWQWAQFKTKITYI